MELKSILEGNYFHIYNRGVNGENIFKDEITISIFYNSIRNTAPKCSRQFLMHY